MLAQQLFSALQNRPLPLQPCLNISFWCLWMPNIYINKYTPQYIKAIYREYYNSTGNILSLMIRKWASLFHFGVKKNPTFISSVRANGRQRKHHIPNNNNNNHYENIIRIEIRGLIQLVSLSPLYTKILPTFY